MEENKVQEEINLLDYLIVILRHKRLIIGITLTTMLIAAVISLKMPAIYRAETKILPPEHGSGTISQFLGQMAGIAGLTAGLDSKTTNDLYIEMLKSRTVLDRMIDRFNLMETYKTRYRTDTRQILKDALKPVNDKKSGVMTIGVESMDPQMASDMANAFVEELNSLTKGLAISEASQRRLFFEEHMKDTKIALIKSEDALRGFQERTGALKVEDQTRSVIEGIASLRAEIAAKEVEIKVMKTYATTNNPDLQRTEEALKGLKEELKGLESKGGDGYDPLMPTGRMPSVGTEYIRKIRDLKFNETLYELLARQYEAAKLNESSGMIIQVIDRAIPPEHRIRPRRAFMVSVSAILGIVMSIFTAFFMEYLKKTSQDAKDSLKLKLIKEHLQFKRMKRK